MPSPIFQPFTLTGQPGGDETYNDIDAANGVFTYRMDDPTAALSTLPKVTTSLKRPSASSSYYVARVNLHSTIANTSGEGPLLAHTNYGVLEMKIHRDATAAEAEAHVKRMLAVIASSDINLMMTTLTSLR